MTKHRDTCPKCHPYTLTFKAFIRRYGKAIGIGHFCLECRTFTPRCKTKDIHHTTITIGANGVFSKPSNNESDLGELEIIGERRKEGATK